MGKKKGRGGGGNELKQMEKLQAILLADSFTNTFRPVTLEKPKVLLPLVNVPMLEYTLEWLSSCGVDEVFVFCSSHAKQIREYLVGSANWTVQSDAGEASPARKLHKKPMIHIIADETATSAGDALRELDRQGVITTDPFVLVSGDVISNINLKRVVQLHKNRRKKDKCAIMTMVTYPRCPTTEETGVAGLWLGCSVVRWQRRRLVWRGAVARCSRPGPPPWCCLHCPLDRSIHRRCSKLPCRGTRRGSSMTISRWRLTPTTANSSVTRTACRRPVSSTLSGRASAQPPAARPLEACASGARMGPTTSGD